MSLHPCTANVTQSRSSEVKLTPTSTNEYDPVGDVKVITDKRTQH